MKISLNKIKSYVQVPSTVSDEELVKLIGSRLVEVEEVVDLAPRYRNVFVVKVVKCEPIPETHLNLCEIDAGVHNSEFKQLANGLIQVVCGAPNVHAGMLAAWIAPGAIVPATYGEENFKIGARKLRGYESNGMLAGADELGFATEHTTIAELEPKGIQPGMLLSDVFDLNDLILDVENKSLTHRPDCFGLIGFAREVAGILGVPFNEPTWPALPKAQDLPLKVKVTDGELCPRYSCAVFDLGDNTPSKYLTADAVFLAKSGMRSIDPIVDLTNILMLETGQPLHAFDYDKLVSVGGKSTPEIIVRAAHKGEELQLLDGKTIQCVPDDILITSSNVPVALAGAMGGKNTESDASTRRVVLESATFSLYCERKTQMAHGIFSEAITRFTKGQPAAMCGPVLAEALARLGVQPLAVVDEWKNHPAESVVKITTTEVNNLLGTAYDVKTIVRTLTNVGFKVSESPVAASDPQSGHVAGLSAKAAPVTLEVVAPGWRTDIHIKEDIIEEVGRLLGYDNITLSLPHRPFLEAEIEPMVRFKQELRSIWSDRLAAHEVLTYSFTSRELLERAGYDAADTYEIVNSISPELQCFRCQLVPSLLEKTRENLKAGHRNFTLYELNQVTRKSAGLTEENTPVLETHLGVVSLGDFYALKARILACCRELGIRAEYAALTPAEATDFPYLEPKRSAVLLVNDVRVGAFGELRAAVARKFKLESVVAAAELNLEVLIDAPRQLGAELQLSRFPSVERDLTIKVAADAPFGRFDAVLNQALQGQGLYATVQPLSIYQAHPEDDTKNLSFHIKFASPNCTLDAAQISAIMDNIIKELTVSGAAVV